MTRCLHSGVVSLCIVVFMISGGLAADRLPRLAHGVENLLVRAKITGNLESFGKGLRGAEDYIIYDLQRAEFIKPSRYNEYGVGFQQDLGVVPEDKAAWWMAEWTEPVQANLIVLSGVYTNQPQPDTAWKIEVRQNGNWTTHAAGVGGWYDRGRYVWGGVAIELIALDSIRVNVFSKDDATPIKSIPFRGEEGRSWLVAQVMPDDVITPAPFQARITPLTTPIMVGQSVAFDGSGSTIAEADFTWDFGDGSQAMGKQAMGKQAERVFREAGIRKVTLTVSDGKHKALYDASTLSSIISMRLDLGWIKVVESVTVAGPDGQYAWTRSDDPNAVRVIREIDQQAMQRDLFDTMKGKPTRLIGVAVP